MKTKRPHEAEVEALKKVLSSLGMNLVKFENNNHNVGKHPEYVLL